MIIRRTTTSINPSQKDMESGAFTGLFFLIWVIIVVLII